MRRLLMIIMAVLALYSQMRCQMTTLPASAQAVVFKKILTYVKTPGKSGGGRLLVIYDENKSAAKDAIVQAFQNEKIDVLACRIDQAASLIKSANIVYISAEIFDGSVKALCKKNKVLSITGTPGLVEKGEASIGVGNAVQNLPGRKYRIMPRIILNLTQLQNEAQEVTELLAMDSVVKVK